MPATLRIPDDLRRRLESLRRRPGESLHETIEGLVAEAEARQEAAAPGGSGMAHWWGVEPPHVAEEGKE